MITEVTYIAGRPRQAQATSTTTFVGLVMTSNTADRFCDWATIASMSLGDASASMAKRTLTPSNPLRIVGVGTEDPEHVHRALDRGRHRAQLDLTLLGDGGDTGGEAAGQRDEHVLDRRGAVVLGGEALGMVGVERERRAVLMVLAEAGEPVDGRAAVRAVHPRAAWPAR